MNDDAAPPPWAALLLSGLSGRTLRVQAVSGAMPDPRPILGDQHLLLPPAWLAHDDARPLARAAVAHAAAHLRHSPAHRPTAGLKPMSLAVVAALEDARVERLAMAELPGLRRWWAPFHEGDPDDADLSFSAFLARLSHALFDSERRSRHHWVDKGRSLFERATSAGLGDADAFRRIGSVLANDLGQMRIRFEPQAYRTSPVYRDDNTWLWQQPPAPEQPPPDTQSIDATPQLETLTVREVPARPDGDAVERPPEIELGRYRLPEWDHRKRRLKRDWCTLTEVVPFAPAVAIEARRSVAMTRARPTASTSHRARRLRRQFEGDDIDLDAAVDVVVDRRLGLAPDARFFRRLGREQPASSVLVLLDLSQSANDLLPGVGASVLALERQAALRLVQTVADPTRRPPPRTAIHGFNSDTRERVSYQRLLDFGHPLDAAAAGRVLSARARHSTRLGTALRHATSILRDERSDRRTLLVVTDGAPSDIDVFDPRYLVEDARVAVLAAQRLGIQVRCLVLDPHGAAQAQRIFGWQHYRVVPNPAAMASHLKRLQARAMLA